MNKLKKWKSVELSGVNNESQVQYYDTAYGHTKTSRCGSSRPMTWREKTSGLSWGIGIRCWNRILPTDGFNAIM